MKKRFSLNQYPNQTSKKKFKLLTPKKATTSDSIPLKILKTS